MAPGHAAERLAETAAGGLGTSLTATWKTPDYRSLAQILAALDRGEATASDLLAATRLRIAALDDSGPTLNAVLDLHPAAPGRVESAADMPLRGVPVLLKANINTGDGLPTHAGSLALWQHQAAADAPVVEALRNAGAHLLGKTNLSEWANFRGDRSSSGWSSIGGQTRNPHVLDRSPCGSSSGSAVVVAAGIVPIAIGTETDGSIVCPAGVNGVVGYKPSIGRVDMRGVIPIASAQDVAGPFTRTVQGAALVGEQLLIAAEGLSTDLTTGLVEARENGLEGRRIGVWRGHSGAGDDPRVTAILDRALVKIVDAGGVVVDPIGFAIDEAISGASFKVLVNQFADELAAYLASVSEPGLPQTLAKLVEFNAQHAEQTMPWFGQELLEASLAASELPAAERHAETATALAQGRDRLRQELSALMAEQRLDGIIAITNGPAWPIDLVNGDAFSIGSSSLAAISGWPTITIPAGAVQRLPIGVSLVTPLNQDAELMRLAVALEARLPPAVRPGFRITVGSE